MRHCSELIAYLTEIGETISIAETFTTGMITHELMKDVTQDSEVFVGSVIASAEHVLTDLLEIKPLISADIKKGSQELSDQLALHLPRLMKAGVYLAISGQQTMEGYHCFVTLLSHGNLVRKEFAGDLPVSNLCSDVCRFVLASLRK